MTESVYKVVFQKSIPAQIRQHSLELLEELFALPRGLSIKHSKGARAVGGVGGGGPVGCNGPMAVVGDVLYSDPGDPTYLEDLFALPRAFFITLL